VIFVAVETPLDQYFIRNTGALFARPSEQALIDPDNPYILIGHALCATHELPVTPEDYPLWSDTFVDLLTLMEEDGEVIYSGGTYFYNGQTYPAERVNVRSSSSSLFQARPESGVSPVVLPEGQEISSQFGKCVLLESTEPGDFSFPVLESSVLHANLQLIRGIGPVTEEKLRQQGYACVSDSYQPVVCQALYRRKSSSCRRPCSGILKWWFHITERDLTCHILLGGALSTGCFTATHIFRLACFFTLEDALATRSLIAGWLHWKKISLISGAKMISQVI